MPWKLHKILNNDVYKNLRYDRIRYLEQSGGEPSLTPYSDNPTKGGYATIGAGFKIDSNWDEILGTLGFDLRQQASQAEKDFINEIKKFVGKDKKFTQAEMNTLITNLNGVMARRGKARTIFGFYDAQEVKAAFNLIADKNQGILNEWLGTRGIVISDSDERIALLSLVYNNVIGFNVVNKVKTPKCPQLLDALANENRPEAWFQIRYESNREKAPGLAKRRYYESDLFNLYDPGQKTDEEMILEEKTIFSMYTRHRDEIESYEKGVKSTLDSYRMFARR
jgi:hypothetical protein